MKGVIQTERIPIKLWAPVEEIEDEAISQLKKTAAVPGVVGLAVMPDVHLGHGATIGSVIATRGMVIPSAVGVDIGCGMMAAKLPFSVHRLSHGNIKYLREEIELRIPVGFTDHKIASVEALLWMGGEHPCGFTHLHAAIQKDASRAARQLGTLGGGNHFVEVCVDEAEQVWLLLHSGSRGVGNKLAQIHIEVAKDLMRRYFIALPDPELAYLVQQTPEFNAYWRDLQWAQAYAMKNRELMMEAVMRAVAQVILGDEHAPITPLLSVNCHHNYAEKEYHGGERGQNVIITRKGAVRARTGDLGIIPGSMGTASYIVRGLGNTESFHSCSHGAGRRMSRTKARTLFSLADAAAQTAGVECKKDASIIDELPGAYKDIEKVMDHQKDLVEIVAKLKQVLCVKG